jgi:hypothetical protein
MMCIRKLFPVSMFVAFEHGRLERFVSCRIETCVMNVEKQRLTCCVRTLFPIGNKVMSPSDCVCIYIYICVCVCVFVIHLEHSIGQWIRNTWKILKCGAGGGRRRSVRPINEHILLRLKD